MRYPEFLQDNGTIGFVAPSLGCSTEPYKSAMENALLTFKTLGYHTDLGPNCFAQLGIGISNTPEKCGEELNQWYLSQENDVLISAGGGELMCEVVPYIDFEAIRKARPKWYLGYSDNTNFTFLSTTLCDTAAFYGPCAGEFGMKPWHQSLRDTMELLTGRTSQVSGYDKWEKDQYRDEEHPFAPYNVTEDTIIHRFPDQDTVMEGRLIGGCMDCLVNLLGTRFDQVRAFNERYQDDGIIWFMEACDLNVMSIRRAIWQMKYAGWFEHLKGFLIGRPMHMGEEMFGCDHLKAVTDLLEEYQVPVIMDLDIGHLSPMMPMVCGSTARVEVKGNRCTIQYTWK